jgi:hypothetical protein
MASQLAPWWIHSRAACRERRRTRSISPLELGLPATGDCEAIRDIAMACKPNRQRPSHGQIVLSFSGIGGSYEFYSGKRPRHDGCQAACRQPAESG